MGSSSLSTSSSSPPTRPKLIEGGWFPLLLAAIVAFLMLTWRTGWHLLERQRSSMRQDETEFVDWVLEHPPIRIPGAAAIFTAATSGIPLGLTHSLRHNRVLHERLLLVSTVNKDVPHVDPDKRVKLIPIGVGITRVLLYFGFMESPNVMEGLRIACTDPATERHRSRTDHLLLKASHGDPGTQGSRHVSVEKVDLLGDAPQRQSSRRLFRRAALSSRGSRARGGDLESDSGRRAGSRGPRCPSLPHPTRPPHRSPASGAVRIRSGRAKKPVRSPSRFAAARSELCAATIITRSGGRSRMRQTPR